MMVKKNISFLLLFLLSISVIGQITVKPAKVKLENGGRMPDVYALGGCYFLFEGEKEIKEASIISNNLHWGIEKKGENEYLIRLLYDYSKTIDLDTVLWVHFTFENGDSLRMYAPVKAYANVKITPYSANGNSQFTQQLPCDEKFGFYASWDYPSYVKNIHRRIGSFEVGIYINDNKINGLWGWYDTGNRTKPHDFLSYFQKGIVTIKAESRIRPFYHLRLKNESVQIHLSQNFPTEWDFECQ